MDEKLNRLSKGYIHDAGVDIILNKNVTFYPHRMTIVDLELSLTPEENEAIIIAPRSSYAAKGLIICNCPIDPYYTGHIHGVVYNGSDDVIYCKKGDSFCQFLIIKIRTVKDVKIKKEGKRGDHSFGSTDGN